MAEEEELWQRFLVACRALYASGSDVTKRREANSWLVSFQRSVQAWPVLGRALAAEDGAVPLELQFLAAKMLRNKVKFDLAEQVDSVEGRSQLRESLLLQLQRHFAGGRLKRAVVTQLCLAVAALAIQMEEWESPIKDLAAKLVIEDGSGALCFIELLQVIPEESESRIYSLSSTRIKRLREQTLERSGDVLNFLGQCSRSFGTQDPFVEEKIFDCFRVWISLVESPGNVVAQSPLIPRLFEILRQNGDLAKNAAVVVVDLLHSYNLFDIPEHVEVMRVLVPEINLLSERFAQAVTEEDDVLAKALAKIFVHLADVYTLNEKGEDAVDVVRLALLGSIQPSQEVSFETWPFWMRFFERLNYSRDIARKRELYSEIAEELFDSCLKHVQIPEDTDDMNRVCSDDLDDDVFCTREDIADVLIGLCWFLQPSRVFSKLKQKVARAAQALSSMQQADRQKSWREMEGLMFSAFAMAGCCKFGNSKDSTVHVAVDFIVMVGLRLQNLSVLLRETITRVFGAFSHFLRFNPSKLDATVSYAIETLHLAPKLSRVACRTVLLIANDCAEELAFAAPRLYHEAFAFDGDYIESDRLDFVRSLAQIVSMQSNENATESFSQVTTAPCALIEHTAKALAANEPTPDPAKVLFAIQALNDLFFDGKTLNPPHPGASVFHKIWPSMAMVTKGFCESPKIAEKVAKFFKIVIRELDQEFKPHLEEFLQLMVDCFQRSSMSPFMYAAGIAVQVFAKKDPAHHQQYGQVVEALCSKVQQILMSMDEFIGNPDIVEDYFIMIDRAIRTMPLTWVPSTHFPVSIAFAANGVLIEHRQANGSLLIYLESTFKTGTKHEQLRPILEASFRENGALLVNSLIAGIAGALPTTQISSKEDGSLGATLFAVGGFMFVHGIDTFKRVVHEACRSPMCEHVNKELEDWLVENAAEELKIHRETGFESVLHEFSLKARARLKRDVQ